MLSPLVIFLSVLLVLGSMSSAPIGRLSGSDQGSTPLAARLTGAEEVPGPGDPDGSGTAVITLDPGQQEVCWDIEVADIAPATAAHIHVGASGVAGEIVVPLTPPIAEFGSVGCSAADRQLIEAIIGNPEAYYANVHNDEYPAGALRGQLTPGPVGTRRALVAAATSGRHR